MDEASPPREIPDENTSVLGNPIETALHSDIEVTEDKALELIGRIDACLDDLKVARDNFIDPLTYGNKGEANDFIREVYPDLAPWIVGKADERFYTDDLPQEVQDYIKADPDMLALPKPSTDEKGNIIKALPAYEARLRGLFELRAVLVYVEKSKKNDTTEEATA